MRQPNTFRFCGFAPPVAGHLTAEARMSKNEKYSAELVINKYIQRSLFLHLKNKKLIARMS
ncbi:MAG: hypothetical protein A2301_03575 [Candidatus Magasanikbacteria bacterium RIFOXYB2_FULL_40_13]|uniref:Uncharacterized protein n=1 Tax=Candidatus Magasanikbacteria bacterium RIFOXYB1_FULL_40_15 TaxID=1798697 RepID=A0A1F6NEZ2_9BACT|nr:MAG: hypothetical protein A2373_03020 [Candidatus Magasanikbacteria bacterium RIFOXYB1_FULL_40_15]OGH86924.1 MAG: hypothetical protein A2301_03575 [Candidatus Magasanikbacteria bacterium RIFOXYB2_FULL_40_13]